jgi:hypothetical protein
MEAGDRIFLAAVCFGNGPHYRLLYNTINKKGSVLINDAGRSKDIINDWDGGTDFWPLGNISDNQVFTSISILELQRKLQNAETPKEIRNVEAQRNLQRISAQSDPADNPLLMIVTLKPGKE